MQIRFISYVVISCAMCNQRKKEITTIIKTENLIVPPKKPPLLLQTPCNLPPSDYKNFLFSPWKTAALYISLLLSSTCSISSSRVN